MSEEEMVEVVQQALRDRGIDDEIVAAGQFNPRGRTGKAFLGGFVGSEVGGDLGGDLGSAVGLAAGFMAGQHAADSGSGLPAFMLVGVSATHVYGFEGRSRSKEPTDLVFQVPREGLTVKVHARVNVRVLELIDEATDSRIELEGNRIPLTHSKDVIHALV
jgi:hypothetical protein